MQKSSIICDMNSRFLGGPVLSHRHIVKRKKGLFESSTGKATSFLIFTRPHRQSKRELLTLWIYILFFHAFKKLQFLIFIRRLSFFQLFINGQFFHRTKVLVYISLFTSNNNTKWSERQHKNIFIVYAHFFFQNRLISTFPNLPQIHDWIPKFSIKQLAVVSISLTCGLFLFFNSTNERLSHSWLILCYFMLIFSLFLRRGENNRNF